MGLVLQDKASLNHWKLKASIHTQRKGLGACFSVNTQIYVVGFSGWYVK